MLAGTQEERLPGSHVTPCGGAPGAFPAGASPSLADLLTYGSSALLTGDTRRAAGRVRAWLDAPPARALPGVA